jgi:hypothetical protein
MQIIIIIIKDFKDIKDFKVLKKILLFVAIILIFYNANFRPRDTVLGCGTKQASMP